MGEKTIAGPVDHRDALGESEFIGCIADQVTRYSGSVRNVRKIFSFQFQHSEQPRIPIPASDVVKPGGARHSVVLCPRASEAMRQKGLNRNNLPRTGDQTGVVKI